MSKLYFSIIGDIVKSKEIDDREFVQNQLSTILEDINKKYADDIAAKFLITLGDEFQGVLKNGKNTYEIILEIVDKMEPVQIRFGIGYGTLSTDMQEYALGIDGESFYLAREAINTAHKKTGFAINFRSKIIEQIMEIAIDNNFILLSQIRNIWTIQQTKLHDLLKLELKQREISDKLGVTQATISRMKSKARIDDIIDVEKNLSKLLEGLVARD